MSVPLMSVSIHQQTNADIVKVPLRITRVVLGIHVNPIQILFHMYLISVDMCIFPKSSNVSYVSFHRVLELTQKGEKFRIHVD